MQSERAVDRQIDKYTNTLTELLKSTRFTNDYYFEMFMIIELFCNSENQSVSLAFR